jgi:hypothetical protein
LSSLRISSPSAAAAFVLVDLLEEHCTCTAAPGTEGTWEITVPLARCGHATLPQILAAAQAWLSLCDLPPAEVTIDGHSHLLSADSAQTAPMH